MELKEELVDRWMIRIALIPKGTGFPVDRKAAWGIWEWGTR